MASILSRSKTNKKISAQQVVSKQNITTKKNLNFSAFFCEPYITEKSTSDKENNKYHFLVSKKANKIELKKFIEQFYNVKVADVNISKKFFSPVNFRNKKSFKSPIKKAIVTLKPGQKIELNI